jgi:2,3-bisphosphoglycerate-independent phosphoglycerate mutase
MTGGGPAGSGAAGVLLILDGWGHIPHGDHDALAAARTPVLDRLIADFPSTLIEASGDAVGLLPGTVGNSEIGHMVIGAGRPLPYDSVLVQQRIDSGELRADATLNEICARLHTQDRALHLVGLCSDGKIHSDIQHLPELLAVAAQQRVPRVWIHAITDGRDVSDGTAMTYLRQVIEMATRCESARIASVTGRAYALDKAGNHDLTEAAGLAIADGNGCSVKTVDEAVHTSQRGDEWVPPCVVVGDTGAALAPVADGDAVLFFNFRSDRIQQLADFLVLHFAATGRGVTAVSLTQYDTQASIPALVPRADAGGGLAYELRRHELTSLRIAEAEKFEHVTYYLNGRDDSTYDLEEYRRIKDPGPPDYIARPQMRLEEVTDAVIEGCGRGDVSLVVANLANIDVVAHTGDFDATVKAVEYTDRAVGQITVAARESGRWVLLVGDHGNAEIMAKPGPDGALRPYGGHTTSPVPVVVVPAPDNPIGDQLADGGSLADIAPTVLALLDRPIGTAMTGRSLL